VRLPGLLRRRPAPSGQVEAYVDPSVNPLHAYRLFDRGVENLEAQPGHAHPLGGSLIVPPCEIEVLGKVFGLRQDGLYRFFRLDDVAEQRLVCTGGLESLLRMIGYLWAYGNADKEISLDDLKRRQAILGCGQIAKIAIQVFQALAIRSRLAAAMSVSAWGGQDDGHTLLELQDSDSRWFLYDPSFNCCFRVNGKRLGILEWAEAGGAYELEYLPGNAPSVFRAKNYDYGFWIAQRWLSEEALRRWYARMAQVPMIFDGTWFCVPDSFVPLADRRRFASISRLMRYSDFRAAFYTEA
jgi:hypothetical protein